MESSFPEATRNMRSPDSEDRPIPNSYWVKPWRFAAGEYPGPAYDGEPGDNLKALLEAGINHFIDLTESHEMVPYVGLAERRAASLGVTVGWERHPILDASIPHTPERMTGALDAIDDAVFAGKNVYVHCLGGIGRTGTVVGCWLVRHGNAGDEALRRVAHWWRGAMNARYLPSSPETLEQEAYVRRWRELSRETENR